MPTTAPDLAAVHRDLIAANPEPTGPDVLAFNQATHDRLAARNLTAKVPSPTDGQFTVAAALAAIEAGYFLGALSTTYLKTDADKHRVVTQGLQTMIRRPGARTAIQLERAKARQAQIARGPRYYDQLAVELGVKGAGGMERAFSWSTPLVGTVEHPPGSNAGPHITDWERLAGYVVSATEGVPWCGCWVNAFCVAGGLASMAAHSIGYVPALVALAKAGIGGWSWHAEGQRGDAVVFDESGTPTIGDHTGIVRERLGEGHYLTREGNTSPPSSSGSQSNGGGLWDKERISTPDFRMIGFARPPWA